MEDPLLVIAAACCLWLKLWMEMTMCKENIVADRFSDASKTAVS